MAKVAGSIPAESIESVPNGIPADNARSAMIFNPTKKDDDGDKRIDQGTDQETG